MKIVFIVLFCLNMCSIVFAAPVSGKIGGAGWNMRYGTASTNSFRKDHFSIELHETAPPSDVCDKWNFTNESKILFSAPVTVGDYTLGFCNGCVGYSVTLFDNRSSYNNIATKGVIKISSITASSVKGTLKADFNSDNFAEGDFEVTLCP